MASAVELKNQGNAFLQQEKFDDAIKCYTSAIELDPKNHVLYSNRSAAYAKVSKYEEALKDAEECIKLSPSWAKGYSRKGAALEFLRKYTEAEAAYLEAAKLDPENMSVLQSLANVRAHNNLKDLKTRVAADPSLRDYLKDPEYVKKLELLEMNPQLLPTLMKDPKIMKTISAIFDFEGKMDVDEPEGTPSPPPPSPPKEEPKPESNLTPEQQQALKEKGLGNAAYKKKDFQAALAHYDKAIELDPEEMTFLTNKSAVYFEMANYEECIKTCEKAIDVGRDHRADFKLIAKALSRIGHCYEKTGDLVNAKKFYDKALSEFRAPDILKKSQALDKKIKEQERLAYIDPEKADEEREQGNKLFNAGEYPAAMKHYNEAIRRNPSDAKIYSNRAACYMKLMEFSAGLKDCEECIKLDPNFVKGYLRKGACLLALKDYAQARTAYRKALELDPGCQEAQNGLQQCFSASMMRGAGAGGGDDDEAAVLERARNDPEVAQILADPAMRVILNQMAQDPAAVQEHLRNPAIAEKLAKLMDAGVVSMR